MFELGQKVQVINPNHFAFGFEGIIKEINIEPHTPNSYKIFKKVDVGSEELWAYEQDIRLVEEPELKKIEIDQNGLRFGKNLLEFSDKGITIAPFKFSDDCSSKSTEYEEYEYNKKVKGEYDKMELLKLYEKKMVEKIKEKCDKVCKEIKAQDDFTILRKSYEEDIKDLYEAEFEQKFPYDVEFEMEFQTKETKQKLLEAEEEMADELSKLRETVEEIEAHFAMIPIGEYETAMKILRKYGVVNKEGKLNV